METLAGLLMADSDASFCVVDKGEGGRLVGHVGLYNCDQVSGVASLAAFFDQRAVGRDWVIAIGLRKFLDYVFQTIGLRKVHFEMPDANYGSLRDLVARMNVVRLEGVLRRHVRIGDDYRDMYQFAIWAEDFAELGVRASDQDAKLGCDGSGFSLVEACLREMGNLPAGQLAGGMRFVEDLELDSLALIELWAALEDRVESRLPDDALVSARCVQDLVELLERAPVDSATVGVTSQN